MEFQTFLNILFGLCSIAMSVIGWFCRQLWDATQTLKTDVSRLEVKLPTEYITKGEFRDIIKELKDDHRNDMQEIKDMLNKIFLKLDEKQDKNG
jgi:hypothetical protein